MLDEALNEEAAGGSGFTSPGQSIHAMSPAAATRPSTADSAASTGVAPGAPGGPRPISGFQDVPATQETAGGASLPPEFDDDDVPVGTDDGEASATVVDGGRSLTPSQLQRLQMSEVSRRGRPLLPRDRDEVEATQLSSVPDAVLRHLRSAESTSQPDGEAPEAERDVFHTPETQATQLWERPSFPSDEVLDDDGPSGVGPEDATVVRPSPYSNAASSKSSSSEHGKR